MFALNKPIVWLILGVILIFFVIIYLLVFRVTLKLFQRNRPSKRTQPSQITYPAPDWGVMSNSPKSPANAEYEIAFNQAVNMAKAGRKGEAYQQFKALEVGHSKDANLQLWLAFTTPYSSEANSAIARAAKLDPFNPNIAQAREWLQTASFK